MPIAPFTLLFRSPRCADRPAWLGQSAPLSDALQQPVIIDNRAGAGGNVGTEVAAHSAADGYTLLMINNAQTINTALNPKLQFDVVHDFTGVAMLATTPYPPRSK